MSDAAEHPELENEVNDRWDRKLEDNGVVVVVESSELLSAPQNLIRALADNTGFAVSTGEM